MVNVVWFKRDLRPHDHAALVSAAMQGALFWGRLIQNPILDLLAPAKAVCEIVWQVRKSGGQRSQKTPPSPQLSLFEEDS